MTNYFPLGIATGSAFCNRTKELTLLEENIKNGKHSLLMATRRYGKSSLALQAISQTKIAYTEIDFYMATSEKVIESYLLNGVVEIIGKALGRVDQLIASIKTYVKYLKPKLDISTAIMKFELSANHEVDPATNIKEALLLLENLLAEKKKKAALLLDEFQVVGIIAQGKGIEGAIRHVAQKTKFLTFVFSGSNRKLLKTMFENENRPLYKLCWKINLDRISHNDYQIHLQKAAKALWHQELPVEIIETILTLTECHPFYVNKLCDKLWTYFKDKAPDLKQVNHTWEEILKEEKSEAIKEISLLSLGQKAVLLQITKQSSQLTSKQTMLELKMTSSSILTALTGLEEKDIIERTGDHHYRIISPIVRFYVAKKYKEMITY